MILPLAAVREIEKFCNIFEELDAVTKELQRDDLNLADVRALFDTVLEVYLRADCYLAKPSSIVHCTDFENTILKVIDNQESTLTLSESNAVCCFVVEHDYDIVESNMNDNDRSLSERVRKKCRLLRDINARYMNLDIILPTINICEILSSEAGFALSDRR